MTTEQDKPQACVVSIDEFRRRVHPEVDTEASEPMSRLDEYMPIGFAGYQAITRTLETLYHPKRVGKLVVVTRFVTGQAAKVVQSCDERGRYYAVDQDSNDIEALTINLERHDEETEDRLRGPLERFYLASLLARHVIRKEGRLDYNKRYKVIRVGEAQLRTDGERRKRILNWRAAARLGINAVSARRPKLAAEIEDYLADVISDRLEYEMSIRRMKDLLNIGSRDKDEVEESLLGLCNPLSAFEITDLRSATSPKAN